MRAWFERWVRCGCEMCLNSVRQFGYSATDITWAQFRLKHPELYNVEGWPSWPFAEKSQGVR